MRFSIPAQIIRNNRFRRDQRQLEEEEEMWFNEDEDFPDVPPPKSSDIDNTLGTQSIIIFFI